MDKSFASLDWKILLGICFVILGLIILFLFLISRQQPKSQINNVSNHQTSQTTSNWQTYKTAYYSITYPPSIIPASINNQSSLVLHLSNRPDFNMTLDIFTDNSHSPTTLSTIFKSFNYKESDILLDKTPAKKYTGSIVMGDKTLQETAIIFQNMNINYKIQMDYNSAEKDVEIENIFSQILSQVKLIYQ